MTWRRTVLSLAALLAVVVGLVSPIATWSPAQAAQGSPTSVQSPTTMISPQIEAGRGSDGGDGPRHVLPAAVQPPIPCASLSPIASRFKDTGLVDCFQYSSQHINGADYKIFYPVEWEPFGGWGSGYLEPAAEALERSAEVFGKLGLMANVNVVFSLLNQDNGEAWANTVNFLTSDQPCVVAVFTPSAELSVEFFQQILAHELFHCFQFWNLDPQMHVDAAARNWWAEGSAEYFSNLVYPNVNEEWGRVKDFDRLSPKTPLTKMTYENTVFFQFLANRIGNEGVIAFLASLATSGGTSAQEDALRKYPGFADLFQDFAQSYLDKQIADTGGGMLPLNPKIKPEEPAISGSTRIELQVDPFVLYRYAPVFDSGEAFAIDTQRSDEPGQNRARVIDAAGTWAETLPPTIDCNDPHAFLVAITVLDAAPEDSTTITYNIAAADAECEKTDSCLIGAWQATDVGAYVMTAYAATNASVDLHYEGQSGTLTYLFGNDEVTVVADEFVIELAASIAGQVAGIEILLDGETTAPYQLIAKGSGNATSVPSGITVTIQVLLDGDLVYDGEVPEFLPLIGGQFTYGCDGNTLALATYGIGGQPLPPITLSRQA